MTWLDIFGLLADIITIIGVPVLAWTTWKLYQQYREWREIGDDREDCLEFNEQETGINFVPLNKIVAFPRPGDIVFLPGETVGG